MRVINFLLVLIFIPSTNFAQEYVAAVAYDNQQFVSLIYGQHTYLSDFGNNFNSFDSVEPFQPVQSVGLLVTTFEPSNGYYSLGNVLSYSQIIPQEIAINDTLNGKINGFNFGLTLLHFNLTPKVNWSFLGLGFGFNTGRMRVKSEAYRSQKNPYWAPTIFFTPQVALKNFIIGINASYQFDVSRRGWRTLNFSKKELDFTLNEFRQTGLMANISIGWKFK
ncbi:MAG: hypothetical protein Crog4KO_17530 [Crocinitomicaceae bacterium]